MSIVSLFTKMLFTLGLIASNALASSAAKRQSFVDLSSDAYVWAYPAVLMKNTREAMIGPDTHNKTYLNRFFQSPEKNWSTLESLLPINTENLYSWAWLDISKSPYVIQQPEIKNRYHAVFIVDAYGNVTYVMKETSLLLVPFDWRGIAPPGVEVLKISTPQAFALSQVFFKSAKEKPFVRELLNDFKIISLDSWKKGIQDDSNKSLALPEIQRQKRNLADLGFRYFENIGSILEKNPPLRPLDQVQLAKLKDLNLTDPANISNLYQDPDARNLIERGLYNGEREIEARLALGFGAKVNGWAYEMKSTESEDDFLLKAAVAKKSLFSIPPQESMQIRIDIDSEARQLNSAYKYVLHFNKIDLPTKNQAWSLQIRESRRGPSENAFANASVNNQTGSLQYNKDGSLDILIQREKPTPAEMSNWLSPSQNSNFFVTMTVYTPDEAMIRRKYIAPSITRLDDNGLPRPKVVQTMMAQCEVSN